MRASVTWGASGYASCCADALGGACAGSVLLAATGNTVVARTISIHRALHALGDEANVLLVVVPIVVEAAIRRIVAAHAQAHASAAHAVIGFAIAVRLVFAAFRAAPRDEVASFVRRAIIIEFALVAAPLLLITMGSITAAIFVLEAWRAKGRARCTAAASARHATRTGEAGRKAAHATFREVAPTGGTRAGLPCRARVKRAARTTAQADTGGAALICPGCARKSPSCVGHLQQIEGFAAAARSSA